MLACARLGHQALLAHVLRQERLAEHVVDLVRSRVVQVLALEQQADAELRAEVVTLGEDRRPPGVLTQQRVELAAVDRICPRVLECLLQLLARGHERLGHEAPTELAEAPALAGFGHQ